MPPAIAIDEGDQVSLAQFAEFWWAEERPAGGRDGSGFKGFLGKKQALMRMRSRGGRQFPSHVGTAGRARAYRLGDLIAWGLPNGADDSDKTYELERRAAAVDPLWHLERVQDSACRRIGARETRLLTTAGVGALHALPRSTGPGGQLEKAFSKGPYAVEELIAADQRIVNREPNFASVIPTLLLEVRDYPGTTDRLLGCISVLVEAGLDVNRILESTLDRLDPGDGLSFGTARNGPSLDRLMTIAADPHAGQRILDLAAGEGGLLVELARAAGGQAVLTGFEPNPEAWAIAKVRCSVSGVSVDLRCEDCLDRSSVLPPSDVVVANPPYGKRRGYVRWLNLAEGCLTPTGRAVMVMPAVSTEPETSSWKEVGSDRADIVALTPSRMRKDTGRVLGLWVLEAQPRDEILFLDASGMGTQQGTRMELGESELGEFRELIEAWRQSQPLPAEDQVHWKRSPRPEAKIHRAELLAESRRVPWEALDEALNLTEQLSVLVNGPLGSSMGSQGKGMVVKLKSKLHKTLLDGIRSGDSTTSSETEGKAVAAKHGIDLPMVLTEPVETVGRASTVEERGEPVTELFRPWNAKTDPDRRSGARGSANERGAWERNIGEYFEQLLHIAVRAEASLQYRRRVDLPGAPGLWRDLVGRYKSFSIADKFIREIDMSFVSLMPTGTLGHSHIPEFELIESQLAVGELMVELYTQWVLAKKMPDARSRFLQPIPVPEGLLEVGRSLQDHVPLSRPLW